MSDKEDLAWIKINEIIMRVLDVLDHSAEVLNLLDIRITVIERKIKTMEARLK